MLAELGFELTTPVLTAHATGAQLLDRTTDRAKTLSFKLKQEENNTQIKGPLWSLNLNEP